MFFRVEYTLRDVDLDESEALEFSQDSPFPTTLVFRRPPPEEQK